MKHKFEGGWVGGGFLSVLQSRLSTLCCHKGEIVVTEKAAGLDIIKRFCCKKLLLTIASVWFLQKTISGYYY